MDILATNIVASVAALLIVGGCQGNKTSKASTTPAQAKEKFVLIDGGSESPSPASGDTAMAAAGASDGEQEPMQSLSQPLPSDAAAVAAVRHDPSNLRAAYLRFYNLIADQAPRLVEPGLAEASCDYRNPALDPLVTGNLRRNLGRHLVYNSQNRYDIGMGPGVELADLTILYRVADENGSRVVIKQAGMPQAMIPLPGYRGDYAFWPQKTALSAIEIDDAVLVRSSDFEWNVFQKAATNVYLLVGTKKPHRTQSYHYDANGLVSVRSDNSCDATTEYHYDGGRLVAVEEAGPVQSVRYDYSYDVPLLSEEDMLANYDETYNPTGNQARLVSVKVSYPNAPAIDNEDATEQLRFAWHKSGLLAGIYGEDGKIQEGFMYRNNYLRSTVAPGEEITYLYYEKYTVIKSSGVLLDRRAWIDHCQITHFAVGDAVGDRTEFAIAASDIAGLDYVHAPRTVFADGNIVEHDYDANHLMTAEYRRNASGELITATRYEYDVGARLARKSFETSQGVIDSSFQYSGGRLVRTTDPTGVKEFGYNDEGMATMATAPGKSQAYRYDDRGLLIERSDLLRKFTQRYSYSNQCQLTHTSSPVASNETTYEADGRIARSTTSGLLNRETTFEYDDADGSVGVTTKIGSSSIARMFDRLGALIKTIVNGKVDYQDKNDQQQELFQQIQSNPTPRRPLP